MRSTKQKRSINRKRYHLKDLNNKMNKKTIHSDILKQLNSLISVRKKQPAFHPNATQFTLNLGEKYLPYGDNVKIENKVFLSYAILLIRNSQLISMK